MRQFYRFFVFLGLCGALILGSDGARLTAAGPDEEYDRLDGTGVSQVKIDGIEWQDVDTGQMQFEFHAYPKGSLIGLGVKIDRTKKDKPVLVAQFKLAGGQVYIRRYVLGFELKDEPHSYTAPSDSDYTKLVLTNKPVAGQGYAKLTLEPAPTQLYPDGHPMLAKKEEAAPSSRAPASLQSVPGAKPIVAPATAPAPTAAPAAAPKQDDDGSLGTFFR